MNTNTEADFEKWPGDRPLDETDISLRAYVSRLPADKLARYRPEWTDDQVIAWDGNFRSDDALMLVCCERDIGARELREVVEGFIRFMKSNPAVESSKSRDR